MEDNANLNRSVQYSTFGRGSYNSNNNNSNSSSGFQPSGILKRPGLTSPPRNENQDTETSSEQTEARNDEVIRRVAEMKHILQTAEEYLTEAEGEATDVESVVTEKSNTESELSSNYGKLKHSDSLLLLTQVKDEEEEETDTVPQEAAVTEAFNGLVSGQEKPRPRLPEPVTPGNSPARGAQ